jgi:hypothetical protein
VWWWTCARGSRARVCLFVSKSRPHAIGSGVGVWWERRTMVLGLVRRCGARLGMQSAGHGQRFSGFANQTALACACSSELADAVDGTFLQQSVCILLLFLVPE